MTLDSEQLYLRCDCHNAEHHMVFNFDKFDQEAHVEVYLLNVDNFWRRLKQAFKYVFKLPPYPYGHYDTILLDKEKLNLLAEHIKETIHGDQLYSEGYAVFSGDVTYTETV